MKFLPLLLLLFITQPLFAQVHKLTYGEVYDYNVGDEIYSENYNHNPIGSGYTFTSELKQTITAKKWSSLNDTVFYTAYNQFLSTTNYPYGYHGNNPPNYTTSIVSFYISSLNDTIINKSSSSFDTLYDIHYYVNHLIDSSFCNKRCSHINVSWFEGGTDTICYEGIGCFVSSGYNENGENVYNDNYLIGYKKGSDSCRSIPSDLKSAIINYDTCITTRKMYDSKVGDEYAFTRACNDKIETILRTITRKNIDEVTKTIAINYHEKLNTTFTKNNNTQCALSESDYTISLNKIDDCYFLNDPYYNYRKTLVPDTSTANTTCNISHKRFDLGKYIGNEYYQGIQHDYYLGLGFFQSSQWFVNPYNGYKLKEDMIDTTETLLYIKNKYYNCGVKPSFSKYDVAYEPKDVVAVFPNPAKTKTDIICNIDAPAENKLAAVSVYNLLGEKEKTFTVPTCCNELKQFNVPYVYLHKGINVIRLTFTNGHSEIHKVVVE